MKGSGDDIFSILNENHMNASVVNNFSEPHAIRMDTSGINNSNGSIENDRKKKIISFDEKGSSIEEKYLYDEIEINSRINGGTSIFLLFEVTYDDMLEGKNNSMNLLNYENTIGNMNITYECGNQFIKKIYEKKKKEYIYNFHVLIPQFLLPINVDYEIPKHGMLHSNINVKIVLLNKINEDIYMKYSVCIDNEKKKINNEEQYSWLINGFKKRVLFISKNSEHVINLTIIPLKIGLINFPSIFYFIKLNNKWIEITKILKKSDNFQVIITPSLHFSPKIWQLV
ncbi:conserved Plasmodium protein, unknown function [Plasmodium malariae]|nr:conserved Plasmodium protein, unknown function [Plasmodium malariae]